MSTQAREQGFTLIEIMVVVGLIAGVIALVAPRLASPNTQIKNTVRKLGALPRVLQNQARLRGLTYRIAIEMGEKGHRYWVESAPGEVRVRTEEQLKEFQNLTSYEQEQQARPQPSFSKDKEYAREETTLPSRLKILEVEFRGFEKSVAEGTTYIHFFPQGLAQEAAIHIGDNDKLHWTIAIRPLTGQADIIPENVRLKDL